MVDGLGRAARDFDMEPVDLSAPFGDLDAELASLTDSGTDLVLFADRVFLDRFVEAATERPDTTWAYVDISIDGAPAVTFAEHEGAFLAGAAAAPHRNATAATFGASTTNQVATVTSVPIDGVSPTAAVPALEDAAGAQ